ncbi:LON peptidase substrate-binding domain-containing protein [uncultured Jatrophihabitans sp.]|uniref:LON peptidase substrate-binding domain-containing protein n=1 Tax=uncultured Jatrophihabitans sp. TaxID=1610747 RepID=UPI0035CC4465
MAKPAIIPLFPLSHVLLPGMPLPLHIFEHRYRHLMADIAERTNGITEPVFGVVALRTGMEAENPGVVGRAAEDTDVEQIGTLAEILELDRKPDGTADLLSVGTRRFEIRELLPTGAVYLRAEVEYLDEPDGELTRAQEDRARELMDVYDSYLVRLAGRGTGSELPNDANRLAYQLAARLPLPPEEKQALLCDATTSDRLVRVARLLRREIALLQWTRSIAVSPAVLRMGTGSN